jgi:hypothetical protein
MDMMEKQLLGIDRAPKRRFPGSPCGALVIELDNKTALINNFITYNL